MFFNGKLKRENQALRQKLARQAVELAKTKAHLTDGIKITKALATARIPTKHQRVVAEHWIERATQGSWPRS